MIVLDRRQALTGIGTLALSTIAPTSVFSRSVAEDDATRITTLSDGNLVLPVSMIYPEVDEQERDPFLKSRQLSTESLEPECNLTLIERGQSKILVDAGAGPNFMQSAGKLPAMMEEAGIDPTEITDVVFTHGHPDHLWGIVDDFDEISFPEAVLHFPRREWEFWNDSSVIDKLSEASKAFAVGAQNRLQAMEERVQLFDPGKQVVKGIEAVDTSGHTPGHVSLMTEAGGKTVFITGDALTNHIVSFEKPNWRTGTDFEPDKAVETRIRVLDMAAADKLTIVGFHLPDGGVGAVEKSSAGFRFVGA